MQLIKRLKVAMDSQYIQENTDEVIELLCDAVAEIKSIRSGTDASIEDNNNSGVKAFAKMLVDRSINGVISTSDIPDLYIEFLGGESNG